LPLLDGLIVVSTDEDDNVSDVDKSVGENIAEELYHTHSSVNCILASTRSESSLECFKPKEPTIEHFKAFEIQKQANYWGELLHAREVFDPGSKLLILSQYIFSVV